MRNVARAVGTLAAVCVGAFGCRGDQSSRSAPVRPTCEVETVAMVVREWEVPGGLAVDSSHVFWLTGLDTEETPGYVMKAPKSPGPSGPVVDPEPLFIERLGDRLVDIAIDEDDVFWIVGHEFCEPHCSSVRRIPKTGGTVQTLAVNNFQTECGGDHGDYTGGVGNRIAVDAGEVYWISGEGIMRVPQEGGTPELLATRHALTAIALDENFVYWTNVGGTVGRVERRNEDDDDNLSDTLADGPTELGALAVGDDDLFVGDGRGVVLRVPKTGGMRQRVAESPGEVPVVNLDVGGSHLAWVTGRADSRVFLAKLDGSDVTSLPRGPRVGFFDVFIDGAHVYFTDRFRVDEDGHPGPIQGRVNRRLLDCAPDEVGDAGVPTSPDARIDAASPDAAPDEEDDEEDDDDSFGAVTTNPAPR